MVYKHVGSDAVPPWRASTAAPAGPGSLGDQNPSCGFRGGSPLPRYKRTVDILKLAVEMQASAEGRPRGPMREWFGVDRHGSNWPATRES